MDSIVRFDPLGQELERAWRSSPFRGCHGTLAASFENRLSRRTFAGHMFQKVADSWVSGRRSDMADYLALLATPSVASA